MQAASLLHRGGLDYPAYTGGPQPGAEKETPCFAFKVLDAKALSKREECMAVRTSVAPLLAVGRRKGSRLFPIGMGDPQPAWRLKEGVPHWVHEVAREAHGRACLRDIGLVEQEGGGIGLPEPRWSGDPVPTWKDMYLRAENRTLAVMEVLRNRWALPPRRAPRAGAKDPHEWYDIEGEGNLLGVFEFVVRGDPWYPQGVWVFRTPGTIGTDQRCMVVAKLGAWFLPWMVARLLASSQILREAYGVIPYHPLIGEPEGPSATEGAGEGEGA